MLDSDVRGTLRRITSVVLLFSTVAVVRAGEVGLITNIDHRQTTSLDGPWHAIVDPYETGYYDYRRRPDPNGFFRNARPVNRSDRVEYDFDASPTLDVPGDWNTQRPELLYYEGTVWYKKSFQWTPKSYRRTFLHFGAANYEARVYLNGEPLGHHVGGFTPFQFEITEPLRNGENTVVVKVDNTRRLDGVPTVGTDWWNYGGLTRRVALVNVPTTFIRDYHLQLDPENGNRLTGWVILDGEPKHQDVRVDIPAAGISEQVQASPTGRLQFSFPAASLKRWSPDRPTRYLVRISTATDTVEDTIGFRTITVRGSEILLNGQPVFLRGICLHEERPVDGGRAFSREHADTLLGWAKQLNCNFVRLAHYPHNEAMLRAADRLGLLVWAEIPVYWTIAFDQPEVYANAERQLAEMITRDRNRACIGMWSVANETPRSDERLQFLGRLVRAARRMDPTRPITAALETHYRDPQTIEIDDPLGAELDILGCNEYVGWYDGLPSKAATLQWASEFGKPLIISEFGGGARYGYHADALTRWSEEYQADLYRQQIGMLDRIKFLRGTSPWILKDFRSPRRVLAGIQDGWNRKGLVSEKGERKQAFDILKAWYDRKAAGVPSR